MAKGGNLLIYLWKFHKTINALGNSDRNLIFQKCTLKHCTFLRNGKIYHCCLPALSDIINKRYNLNIPKIGIDIHSNISGADILEFLNNPSPVCAYCKEPEYFPWEISKREKDEWL